MIFFICNSISSYVKLYMDNYYSWIIIIVKNGFFWSNLKLYIANETIKVLANHYTDLLEVLVISTECDKSENQWT